MMPLAVMPAWMQPFSYVSPVRWAILVLRRRDLARLLACRDGAALCHPRRPSGLVAFAHRRPPLPGHARMTTTRRPPRPSRARPRSHPRRLPGADARPRRAPRRLFRRARAARRCRDVVVEAMADYLLHHNANTHWRYPTSEETDAALAAARARVADFLHARADEIVVRREHDDAHVPSRPGAGARVAARATRSSSPSSITTPTSIPGARSRAIAGSPCGPSQFDPATGRARLGRLRAADHARTKLRRHRRGVERPRHDQRRRRGGRDWRTPAGALTFVDAVHYAPHALVDVRALGCDFLACSPYKFYGPHVGILYGRRRSARRARRAEAAAGARRLAGAARDRHAEPRGDRRRRGGGRLPRRRSRRTRPGDRRRALQRAFAALHERGDAPARRASGTGWARSTA